MPAEAELESWRALRLFRGPMEAAAAARIAATAPAGLESGQVERREGAAPAAEPVEPVAIVRHFKGDCPLTFVPMHMPLIPALTCLSFSSGQ